MQPERSGEKSVAESDLRHVVGGCAACTDDAGDTVAPDIEVMPGVGDHGRLAGGAGGTMDPHHVAHRAGKKLERIILPQGRLSGHRQFF